MASARYGSRDRSDRIDDLLSMNVNDMTPEQRTRFEIKREHEFYSYYEPIRALATSEMNLTDLNSDEAVARHVPAQCTDKALMAFCQLAAIRLKMRRAMIFFFDSTHAYILAEATRTLSLQDDAVFDDEDDALWLGTTKIPRGFSVCEHTVNLPSNGGTNAHEDDGHIIHIINNLTEDTRFCNRPYVVGGPRARFYAGVPITTPKGLKIGAFCVLDDEPHDGLTKKETAFMQDMGSAVMSHLDMIKAKVEQRRGTEMVAALSAFTARDSSGDLHSVHPRQLSRTKARIPSQHQDASRIPLTARNLNLSSATAKRPAMRRSSSGERQYPRSTFSSTSSKSTETSAQASRPRLLAKDRTCSETTLGAHSDTHSDDSSLISHAASNDTKPHQPEQSANDVMQSASVLIRNAVDAHGVLFLDASVTGFGDLVDTSMLEKTPGDSDTVTSGTESLAPSEGEDTAIRRGPAADQQPCAILGASYSDHEGAPTRELASHLTPKYLRSLLRRFKGAKVWNFNEHGDDYLDEQASESQSASDGGTSLPISNDLASAPKRKNRHKSKVSPAKQLALAFPGVRSLILLGLWDNHRNQWRAGCVIWTCTPMRMFSQEGDLHYLTAFGDVIMAKLARLDVDIANNVKSDFISSISHELRSPLHGILGTVEVLQDQSVDYETAEMISQIDVCGRTLLDIVDHLLEFSRINNIVKRVGSEGRTDIQKTLSKRANQGSNNAQVPSSDADVLLDALTEEVVESTVYSFCCSKDQRTLSERNVTVTFNIENNPDTSWECKLNVGAWKRVCVNLVNNALKYTSEGSINISLKTLPPTSKFGRPLAQFSVTDTGRGMSKTFLRTRLFRAFSQEDELMEGTGLGMSMVARIVRSWKGRVNVKSSQGRGSIVNVTMPLMPTRRPKAADHISATPAVTAITSELSDLSVHIFGFPEKPDRDIVVNGRYQQLVAFSKTCSAFGIRTTGPSWQPSGREDFIVVAEYDLPQLRDMLASSRDKQSQEDKAAVESLQNKPVLVLCKDFNSARLMKDSQIEQLARGSVEFVAQPCGPNRLASVIKRMFEPPSNGGTWTPRQHAPSTPRILQESVAPRFDTWRESHTRSGAASPDETDVARRLTLRSRRTSSDNHHQPVSLIQHQVKSKAEDHETDGRSVETSTPKVFNAAEDALTATSLAKLDPPPASQARNQSVVRLSSVPSDGSKPCLLLVDDNPINLQLLVTYAKKNGHAMLKAIDGQKAVDAYKSAHASGTSDKPEVVLMDISMPIMDGFEATRQIRSFERERKLKPVVIIALTGLGSSEAQHEAYISGINLFLTKPVRLKELTRLLGTIKETFR